MAVMKMKNFDVGIYADQNHGVTKILKCHRWPELGLGDVRHRVEGEPVSARRRRAEERPAGEPEARARVHGRPRDKEELLLDARERQQARSGRFREEREKAHPCTVERFVRPEQRDFEVKRFAALRKDGRDKKRLTAHKGWRCRIFMSCIRQKWRIQSSHVV
jgi:hypothetical protein